MNLQELMPLMFDEKPKPRKKRSDAKGRGSTIIMTCWGETKSLLDWSKDDRVNKCVETLISRHNAGWEPEKVLSRLDHTFETRQTKHWRKPRS